jgi:hypothetical protein
LHDNTNNNDEFLCNFAIENNLIVASTQFPHKWIYTGTWLFPDNLTLNQIDHVLTGRSKKRMIIDVKTRRGYKCDSEHFLVQALVKQKLVINKVYSRYIIRYYYYIIIIIRKQNIVRQIKAKRLGWFGHIQRMDERQITSKITNWMPTLLNRPKGRPKERWWDSVRGDLKIVGVLDWKKNVFGRKYWQGIPEQAKTHPGL